MTDRKTSSACRWCVLAAQSTVVLMAVLCGICCFSRPFGGGSRPLGPEQFDGTFPRLTSQPLFEAHNFVAPNDSLRSRLDVSCRIPYSCFIAVHSQSADSSSPLMAHGEVTIDVLTPGQLAVAHRYYRLDIAWKQAPSSDASPFVERLVSTEIPPGPYTVSMEVNDLESNRRYPARNERISLKDFARCQLSLSDILLVKPSNSVTDTISPFNLGGNVPFGSDLDAYFEVVGQLPIDSIHITYSLFRIRERPAEREEKSPEKSLIKNGSIPPSTLLPVLLIADTRSPDRVLYHACSSPTRTIRMAVLHVRGDTLQEGAYELEIVAMAGDSSTTSRSRFRIEWLDKPRSLASLEFAIDALRYIASADELKQLKEGDAEDQRAQFSEFWKKKDPTPATAYNEAEAEYYERVDHALTTFGTMREPDGVKTDRGKVYILYGAPDIVDRLLPPNALPQETWTYTALHRRMIFSDADGLGDYRLTSTEAIR